MFKSYAPGTRVATVCKQGWLKKKAASRALGGSVKRYVVLKSDGKLIYHKAKIKDHSAKAIESSGAKVIQLTGTSQVAFLYSSGTLHKRGSSKLGSLGSLTRQNSSGSSISRSRANTSETPATSRFVITGESHRHLYFTVENGSAEEWVNTLRKIIKDIGETKKDTERKHLETFASSKMLLSIGGAAKGNGTMKRFKNPGWVIRVGHGEEAKDCFVFADTMDYIDEVSDERVPVTLDMII